MSRAEIVIHSTADRERAHSLIDRAPFQTRITFKATRRSIDQNSMMWSLLGKLAAQLVWHGQKLRSDDWKLVMLDGLKRELRIVPNIDGTGFVNLGRSSSDLTKNEISELIELILAFGAQHGVIFNEPEAEKVAADSQAVSDHLYE